MRLLPATLVILAALARLALAQTLVGDRFEGPDVSLRDAGGDARYKIEPHARVAQGAHSGQWCERLTVRGDNGTYVYVAHEIAPARIISELAPSVWLKADRPGLQLLARVTLPRSIDQRTGKPLTTLVRGSAYTQVGAWQQLRLDDLPQMLDRQVRVLRVQFKRDVDAREAYIDRILLNVYGGPGVTNAWVDDLEIAGVVAPQAAPQAAPVEVLNGGAPPSTPRSTLAWAGGAVPTVERSGPLLLVGGKPFFPRIIEHRGEPLARLKALGFNAVWLGQAPGSELLREAAAAGLWLVAPPPPAQALEAPAGSPAEKIGSQLDGILAWDLGRGLARGQLDATRKWAKLVEAADSRGRPIFCEALSDLTAYTRPPIHVLMARRDVIGTSMPLSQFTTWLRQRTQLALTGTILWAAIQTEPPPELVEQMAGLARGQIPSIRLQESQIMSLAHAALAAGARGLCFTSHSRLDANDNATRLRAATLELVNLELDLIDRWPATGNFATTADSSDTHATGAVIATDRSRLLLPMFTPANSQLVMGTSAAPLVNYTVGGVPEEDKAYELSLASCRSLASKRVSGGTQVLLGELERDSLVVFTSDQLVYSGLNTKLKETRHRATELAHELAAAELIQTEVGQQRLTALGHAVPTTQPLRITAQTDLRQYEALAAKGDEAGAFYQARHALATLRRIQRAHFDEALTRAIWPLGDPWTANFATLDEHFRFANELSSAQRGPNRLPEGVCEDLQQMMQAGWKHFRYQQPEKASALEQPLITTAVDLSPQAAHTGHNGLRLRAVLTDPERKAAAVETPPMWVTTAAVPVNQGQLVEIQAWVSINRPIIGSVDGLLVIDTLSGETLAQRVGVDKEWQQVKIYRAVPRSGPMSVTFALSGLGEAWIDDVSIQIVERAGAAPQQQAQQAQQTRPPTGTLGRGGS